MAKRTPKPDDQDQVERVRSLLWELCELNPDIEGAIWIAGAFSCIVDSYSSSGVSYDFFLKELSRMAKLFKFRWDE